MKTASFTLALFLIVGCNPHSEAEGTVHEADEHDHAQVVSETESVNTTVTVEGTISGFDCAVVDYLCPTTHRGADYTNGVFTDDKEFFFVVNIPQEFLTDLFLERISVVGTTYGVHKNAVEPEKIYLISDTQATLIYDEGYYIDATGEKSVHYNKKG